MRVLMVSKALVVGLYQRKLELLAARGVELLAITPPGWRDERGETPLERSYTAGYTLERIRLDIECHFLFLLLVNINEPMLNGKYKKNVGNK